MNIFSKQSTIVITCQKRLSPFVHIELKRLGYNAENIFATGLTLQGSMTDCMVLNLNLRCASQVLFSLERFKASNSDELYKKITELPWEEILVPDGYVSVTSYVNNPSIQNNLFANVKVKDAIVDKIRKKTGTRPNSGPDLDKAVVHLHWINEQAEIFIDTSGETLTKHSYRQIPGKAPMLEALASATILAGKWNQKGPFVNPMCGSGTLAIEAYLIATNQAPGLFRNNYSFKHFVGFNPQDYINLRKKLRDQVIDKKLTIIASDIRVEAIEQAKINAQYAEVENGIEWHVCDFKDTPLPSTPNGVIYINPEYGERLGNSEQLIPLYKSIGDFLKQQAKGYTGYIFTGNIEASKHIGLKSNRKIEFYNANIDARLLEYELY